MRNVINGLWSNCLTAHNMLDRRSVDTNMGGPVTKFRFSLKLREGFKLVIEGILYTVKVKLHSIGFRNYKPFRLGILCQFATRRVGNGTNKAMRRERNGRFMIV
jgi:hypothetical protein